MAARTSYVFMKNFPVLTVEVYEGTLTRYTTSVSPTGGVNEGAAVYSAPVSKGSLLVLKDHTDKGVILMERVAVDGEQAHGIAVSEPFIYKMLSVFELIFFDVVNISKVFIIYVSIYKFK